ncbi:hypothetical protein KCTC52924_03285 [Arenibacter antarcticus]
MKVNKKNLAKYWLPALIKKGPTMTDLVGPFLQL